ncbi:chromodomain Y-like protein [Patella vulgata]|uniref:chromodomain Y-like protein n=1 Tax=Patella vulgata TaxID=6465 RepID=UPI0024A7D66C|nr:chromodomain Y-like protein [Patella vulgata]
MATSGSDSDVFEVKEIIKQREKKGIIEYLVRWDGFGEEEDSWEPSKSLVNCVDQIKTFVQAQDANKMEQKSAAKSRSKGRARSRSRGRSRSRARSKSNTRKSKTKKSSSRSSKTTAAVVVSSDEEDLIVTPKRQTRRTEVVTRTKTNNFPGRMETSASLMKVTTDEDDPEITKTTTVLRERREVEMVENHKTLISSIKGGESEEPNFVVKMWNYADTAVLILFICISVFLLSFVLEKYIDPRMIWKAVINSYKSSIAYIISSWGTICTMAGRAWNTTSATLKTNWKNLSGK